MINDGVPVQASQDQQALATLATPRLHLSSSSSADPKLSRSWRVDNSTKGQARVHKML